jgi:hypothetical protein
MNYKSNTLKPYNERLKEYHNAVNALQFIMLSPKEYEAEVKRLTNKYKI